MVRPVALSRMHAQAVRNASVPGVSFTSFLASSCGKLAHRVGDILFHTPEKQRNFTAGVIKGSLIRHFDVFVCANAKRLKSIVIRYVNVNVNINYVC